MHKYWKKRLKETLKDKEAVIAITGVGVLTGLLASFPVNLVMPHGNHAGITIGMIGLTTLVFVGMHTAEMMFKKDTYYDHKIVEKERMQLAKEKAMKDNVRRKEMTEKEQYLNSLHAQIEGLWKEEKNRDLASLSEEVLHKIHEIRQKYSQEQSEEYYLTASLPKDISESLMLFLKLDEKNQEEMKETMIEMVKGAKEELEKKFILQHQQDIKDQLKQKVQLVKMREY